MFILETEAAQRIAELEGRLAAAERDAGRLLEALELIFWLPAEQPHLDGSDLYDESQVIAKHAIDSAAINHPGSKGRDSTEGGG